MNAHLRVTGARRHCPPNTEVSQRKFFCVALSLFTSTLKYLIILLRRAQHVAPLQRSALLFSFPFSSRLRVIAPSRYVFFCLSASLCLCVKFFFLYPFVSLR